MGTHLWFSAKDTKTTALYLIISIAASTGLLVYFFSPCLDVLRVSFISFPLPSQGRLFYTCDAPKAEQCSFFKWIEDVNPAQTKSRPSVALHDIKSIGTYLRSQKISLYEECQLLVRYSETLCTLHRIDEALSDML